MEAKNSGNTCQEKTFGKKPGGNLLGNSEIKQTDKEDTSWDKESEPFTRGNPKRTRRHTGLQKGISVYIKEPRESENH